MRSVINNLTKNEFVNFQTLFLMIEQEDKTLHDYEKSFSDADKNFLANWIYFKNSHERACPKDVLFRIQFLSMILTSDFLHINLPTRVAENMLYDKLNVFQNETIILVRLSSTTPGGLTFSYLNNYYQVDCTPGAFHKVDHIRFLVNHENIHTFFPNNLISLDIFDTFLNEVYTKIYNRSIDNIYRVYKQKI